MSGVARGSMREERPCHIYAIPSCWKRNAAASQTKTPGMINDCAGRSAASNNKLFPRNAVEYKEKIYKKGGNSLSSHPPFKPANTPRAPPLLTAFHFFPSFFPFFLLGGYIYMYIQNLLFSLSLSPRQVTLSQPTI